MPWVCPACNRQFGRTNQSHVCAPAMPMEDYLARHAPERRAVFEAVVELLQGIGPVFIEAVEVGIFARRSRTFAEFRHKPRRIEAWFMLSRPLEHPRIRRSVRTGNSRVVYFVDLRTVDDVDDEFAGWLTEAFWDSPP